MQPEPSIDIFESSRLLARRIVPSDVAALFHVYGDADAMRWVGDGRPLDLAQCERWVEVTLRNYATRGYGMFAVLDRDTAAVVGFCGLVHPDSQAEAELKYAFARDVWGQGFATEAATALLAVAPSRFGLRHAIATAAPENLASHRVLLKAGMRPGYLLRNEDGSRTQRFEWEAAMPSRIQALTDALLQRTRKDWFRTKPFVEARRPVDPQALEHLERRLGARLPDELREWLLVMGYGNFGDALSIQSDWFSSVEQGALKGATLFGQDGLGNFYACLSGDGRIVFFRRREPEYAILAPSFLGFMEELARRDFQLDEWIDGMTMAPYGWDA